MCRDEIPGQTSLFAQIINSHAKSIVCGGGMLPPTIFVSDPDPGLFTSNKKMLREITNDNITPKKRDSMTQNDLYEKLDDDDFYEGLDYDDQSQSFT